MKVNRDNKGFSLTEVLLSIGILAVGMTFVAGVFPVAIHFTTIATERTIAAVVADEAFAKIRLYGIGEPNDPNAFLAAQYIDPNEFAYPSTNTDISKKQYYWSALCRYIGERNVQVTVFVCRKTGSSGRYWYRDPLNPPQLTQVVNPVPVWVNVLAINPDELSINFVADPVEKTFINDGYTIVDNQTGDIYRVLERDADVPDRIVLDRDWESLGEWPRWVWVIPPPVGGGRYPCIAIYQKVIRF